MTPSRLVSIVIPTFRDGGRALAAAEAIRNQRLPAGINPEIILVDDGSGDGTGAFLRSRAGHSVEVVELSSNQGRAAARNAGVVASHGDFVIFLDCDCSPAPDFLSSHIDALSRGALASTGHVTGDGRGFWSRYQQEASDRRRLQHEAGNRYVGSSQNLAVQRSAFEAVGGFDIGYRRYGFEDRDLLLRLAELGEVAWTSAEVCHKDELTLPLVAAKMSEAGRYSAQRFADRYPAAYEQLGYAAIDVRTRSWLEAIASILGPLYMPTARWMEPWLERLPYPIAKSMVKAISALAFLYGTSRRSSSA